MSRWALLASLGLAACGPDGRAYFADGGFLEEGTHANVMRRFGFTTTDADGHAPGFDLDGDVSADGDEASCGHGDLVSPDGLEGVDNQLAEVWTLVAPLVGEQVEGLLQGAINEGRVLIMVELAGVDDLQDDDDVTVRIFRGAADPEVGSFGVLTPDQTYGVDPSIVASVVEGASIVDGVIEAGPVSFDLPVDILEANFVLRVLDGRIRFEIGADGSFEGIIGGVFDVDDFLEEMLQTDAREEVELVSPFFLNNADMEPVDGRCRKFSTAFTFEGTRGFVVRYDDADD